MSICIGLGASCGTTEWIHNDISSPVVTGVGEGLSRDEALKDAMRQAIRQAGGFVMSSQVNIANERYGETSSAVGRGTIRSYKILREVQETSCWVVEIIAEVHAEDSALTTASSSSNTTKFDGRGAALISSLRNR